jgi:hypothetical protein
MAPEPANLIAMTGYMLIVIGSESFFAKRAQPQ